MPDLYPAIAPYDQGLLDVGDGQRVYWETCGNPAGKPAVVVHGGPGSGCMPWHRQLFDPARYRIVLFDQRQCGRSTPHASAPGIDLAANTTQHLVADMERLRTYLGVERWLVFGGSWGSVLTLAYAEQYPERVTEIVLFGIATGRHRELDWLFRGGVAIFFPAQWDQLRAALPDLPADADGGEVVAAVARRLHDPDPDICQRAADAWCLWESATLAWPPTTTLSGRFSDPAYALAFARLVTHYVIHNLFLEDGALLRGAGALADIPGVLINGRFDYQSPIANAWALRRAWNQSGPRAELVIVDDAGHSPTTPTIAQEIVAATDRFAASGSLAE